MPCEALDLVHGYVGVEIHADPVAAVQVRAVADAGVLFAQGLREIGIALEDDVPLRRASTR